MINLLSSHCVFVYLVMVYHLSCNVVASFLTGASETRTLGMCADLFEECAKGVIEQTILGEDLGPGSTQLPPVARYAAVKRKHTIRHQKRKTDNQAEG